MLSIEAQVLRKWFVLFEVCLIYLCVCSVPDLGELLQCALGHEDPGYFHSREASCSGAHHSGRTRSDL